VTMNVRYLSGLIALIVSTITPSMAGLMPDPLLSCAVGSFDSQKVQLKCGPGFKEKRQMSRAYFERIYGDPTEGKVVKIDTSNTAAASQLKSY
jgi:hypothetical protein